VELAGAAQKKVARELGGSDPFIGWRRMDLETVARRNLPPARQQRQSCNGAKRFHRRGGFCRRVLAKVTTAMEAVKMGEHNDGEGGKRSRAIVVGRGSSTKG